MESYLGEIMAFHRQRTLFDSRNVSDRLKELSPVRNSFFEPLYNNSNISLIAEIKRRSPSKGVLNSNLDVPSYVRAYSENGATAISVLTDSQFFGGSPGDLISAHEISDIPLLRKDFIVSKNDVIDAIEWGAAAILLIVSALQDNELIELFRFSQDCGIDVLVECHTRPEIEKALALDAPIIGINQRNLKSFEVNTEKSASLISDLRSEALFVAESGLKSVDDVYVAREAGFTAILVGEALVTASNLKQSILEFSSVSR